MDLELQDQPWHSCVCMHDTIWYIGQLQLVCHPVAVVQYTFTHKQYAERYNKTEYRERNIHDNKNIYICIIRTKNLLLLQISDKIQRSANMQEIFSLYRARRQVVGPA